MGMIDSDARGESMWSSKLHVRVVSVKSTWFANILCPSLFAHSAISL
eukprot:CAMPEP_0183323834 /NCGR_PEP_ID=MMETSP0160_2-20130417/75456_1 /TAXON_ID=2839 ORGANISM="Odontella Sinensis, Strain Grunow 1884" /NCGR_SAMPLE_ID=MMETSP0160_2 /ASSEMBLY_ACC=CAM_ASM_000250 /LENGTH=46 /DNA_ID= /DNA_START= /DNA_END= /DNA_ORIENTATION=